MSQADKLRGQWRWEYSRILRDKWCRTSQCRWPRSSPRNTARGLQWGRYKSTHRDRLHSDQLRHRNNVQPHRLYSQSQLHQESMFQPNTALDSHQHPSTRVPQDSCHRTRHLAWSAVQPHSCHKSGQNLPRRKFQRRKKTGAALFVSTRVATGALITGRGSGAVGIRAAGADGAGGDSAGGQGVRTGVTLHRGRGRVHTVRARRTRVTKRVSRSRVRAGWAGNDGGLCWDRPSRPDKWCMGRCRSSSTTESYKHPEHQL